MNCYIILEEQLEIYFDKQGSKIKRIIFDDLQKVDFCFPLLKNNDLFFAALKNFCQKKGVDLMILCDKKAEFGRWIDLPVWKCNMHV